MTSKQADRILSGAIRDGLRKLGFRENSRLFFTRNDANSTSILIFGGRMENAVFKFTFSVGIRFGEIEAILHPDNEDSTYPTILMPVHLLHQDRAYFEWEFSDESDANKRAREVLAEVAEIAEPFLTRYGDLQAVEESLASPCALDWFVLTPDQRVGVRAAMAKFAGREDEAKAILDEALQEPKNAIPARKRRIEDLKSRLFSAEE